MTEAQQGFIEDFDGFLNLTCEYKGLPLWWGFTIFDEEYILKVAFYFDGDADDDRHIPYDVAIASKLQDKDAQCIIIPNIKTKADLLKLLEFSGGNTSVIKKMRGLIGSELPPLTRSR